MQHEAGSLSLADRCFGPCGTGARRLPGTPVGDTPHLRRFSGCMTEKDGSGRRDPVQRTVQRSKMAILGSPSVEISWPRSMAGGLVMKKEVNENRKSTSLNS